MGGLWIQDTDLTNINGLRNLETADTLFITDNSELEKSDGLSSLTSVPHYFTIGGNHKLTDISGLSKLTTVGPLCIWINDALTNLDGLHNLVSVGDLCIGGKSYHRFRALQAF